MQAVADGEAELGDRAHRELPRGLGDAGRSTCWPSASTSSTIVREVTHADPPPAHRPRRPARWTRSPRSSASPSPTGSAARSSSEHLADVEHEATDSTAEAVRRVSRVDRPWVAIGTRLAADLYECAVRPRRHRGLARQPHALRLPRAQPGAPGPRRRATRRASSAASAPTSRAALLLILSEFAHRYVNLTKVESRPSKTGPRRLHLLHRHRGPARRPAHRAGAQVPRLQAALGQGAGLLPRLIAIRS